ncbi:M949_RS01915 family surface polysaccharide biosynthesis protein [Aquimarina aquimarini]|uniref:M949_RS01915 family surface polysaccharide biosynthesis protein n=1 Tax=Aquimarina aquimarini TaxID=1191734 RepID=UPI000D558BB5|nr:hypothetical protein [Aquimarina aquimarini]
MIHTNKTNTLVLVLLSLVLNTYSQNYITKDLDKDEIKDSIYINPQNSSIVCKLSTQKYIPIASKRIESIADNSYISETKNGFQYNMNWMRAGYKAQFRFNPTTKNINLIGMSRYEFGDVANDGSGESSVNLLTNKYIGNWKYFDLEKDSLIHIPTIYTKMKLPKTNLKTFSENSFYIYSDKCSTLYHKYKKQTIWAANEGKEYNIYIKPHQSDIAFDKVPFIEIPTFISYEGNAKNVISWKDAHGEHFVLTSETGIYSNSKFSHEENQGADAELFAYHYIKKNNVQKRIWKVYDFITDCPVEIVASFIKNTLHVTDLDNNGVKEIWLMYKKVCHGDVSPSQMKIIMYEGKHKFAMRGYNKVMTTSDSSYGGKYKFDTSFIEGPKVFRDFGISMWDENILHKWGE